MHPTHPHATDRAHREEHPVAGRYLREVVFAASDGLVTTFAVVSGAAGAGLTPIVVVILGLANLIADGISMGLGEYMGSKSEIAFYRSQQRKEEWEVQHIPHAEVAEIREIFSSWGFAGEDLDRAVAVIIKHPEVWVDIMMKFELGLLEDTSKSPAKRGFVMFLAFSLIGAAPLLPFLLALPAAFSLSVLFAGLAMFTVGALRSHFTRARWWRAGGEMLAVGTLAAGSAYAIGAALSGFVGK